MANNAGSSLPLDEMVADACRVERTAPEVSPVADVCTHVKALAAEVERLQMLLIRKSEALSVFASPAMWILPPALLGAHVWNGTNEHGNPTAFAALEAAATEACDDPVGAMGTITHTEGHQP